MRFILVTIVIFPFVCVGCSDTPSQTTSSPSELDTTQLTGRTEGAPNHYESNADDNPTVADPASSQQTTSRLCPVCFGSGSKMCTTCAGDGWVHNFNDLAFPDDPTITGRSTCHRCGGSGNVTCNCGGSGRIIVKRK